MQVTPQQVEMGSSRKSEDTSFDAEIGASLAHYSSVVKSYSAISKMAIFHVGGMQRNINFFVCLLSI